MGQPLHAHAALGVLDDLRLDEHGGAVGAALQHHLELLGGLEQAVDLRDGGVHAADHLARCAHLHDVPVVLELAAGRRRIVADGQTVLRLGEQRVQPVLDLGLAAAQRQQPGDERGRREPQHAAAGLGRGKESSDDGAAAAESAARRAKKDLRPR